MRRVSVGAVCVVAAFAAACYPRVSAYSSRDELHGALMRIPAVNRTPVHVRVYYDPGINEIPLGGVVVHGYGGSRIRLFYSPEWMLKKAAEASIQRWWDIEEENGYPIVVSGEIKELQVHDLTDVGNKVTALVRVVVHVRIAQKDRIFLDRDYDSGKQYSDFFKMGWVPGGEEYDRAFGQTIYQALLVSLDSAMEDATRAFRESAGSRR